jgi:hypothetical protein
MVLSADAQMSASCSLGIMMPRMSASGNSSENSSATVAKANQYCGLSIGNSAAPGFAFAQTKGRSSGTALGETDAACGASAVGRATKKTDPQVLPGEAHRRPP